MRECTVCGEKDFEEHDGHYFCATCNTQSQDVRVLVTDEDNFGNFRRSGLIKEASTPKEDKKRVCDYGRPWSVYEAYQIIIQHQVEALIKLGAQESLRRYYSKLKDKIEQTQIAYKEYFILRDRKDVVFQIWVNYLSRLGVAFSNTPENNVKYERQRELFPSTTNQPILKNVFGKRTRKKTLGPSGKKMREQMERDQVVEALQGEDFYSKDDPLNNSEDEGEKLAEWSSSDEDEQRWGKYRKSLRYDAVEKVRMTSTVAVCFLGLMHTNPLTTATDLRRWIKYKKVPYLDVRSILPKDMKFYLNDWKLFGLGSVPQLDEIRRAAGTIAYYIGLRNFPDFPLEELISKYILQLDLPAEFHGYTVNVYTCMQVHLKYIPSASRKKTIYWEGIAMAYIVIMLKIFFGFNDRNEILMSEYSEELNDISECDKPLFVWTDWVQHMKNKMNLEEQRSKTTDKKLASSGLGTRIQMKEYKTEGRIFKRAFRDSLAKTFFELSRRWKDTALDHSTDNVPNQRDEDSDAPIDFDIDTLEDDFLLEELDQSRENDWNTSGGHSNAEGAKDVAFKEIRLKSDHFRKSTVQHLLNPETYLIDIKKRMETKGQSGYDTDFSVSEVILSDFYEDSRQTKRRKKNATCRTDSQRNDQFRLDEEETAMNEKIEQYQAVIEKLRNVRNHVEASLDFETQEMCLSYDWLIKICCNEILAETDMLRSIISKLELMFLSDPDDSSLSKAQKRQRKKLRSLPYLAYF